MALVLLDRVQQTGTANTTVSFTLSGSVTGYQSFTAIGNGNTTYYAATDVSGNWEAGIGTYATGGTLTRTTILSSSNSGSAVTFSGTVNVFVTYPASKSVNLDASSNVSALGTVTSGVWNGSTIPVAYGGTGVTSSSGASSVVLRDANQNIVFNNYVAGFAATTASAGTTVLTVASARNQILVGSTTHTFQMPNATTLQLGQSFLFVNNSSGILTITNNASAVIDTIPSGGAVQLGATNISTSAGTFGIYSFLPGSYDFNNTTATFNNATISSAVWNGTTIASGYGGTGLTTFSAANNALYSTGATTLTAGTLPVAAGGTGATTLTGYVYGNGTSAMTASTTIPTSSLSGSINLATQVTGTLPLTNGGTGQTTAVAAFNALNPMTTTGDIIYEASPTTAARLGIGTTGQVLTVAGGLPSWSTPSTGAGTITVTDFTATSGQTTFTVSYTVGLVEVFQNGAKLAIADYTATNGTSIVLATGATTGDLIEVVAFSSLNIYSTITYEVFNGTGSQTVFTMSSVPANAASLLVAISGVVQDPGTYSVSSTTLTFTTAPPSGTGNISVRYLGIASVGTVGSFSAGTTGLTPSSATTGAVVLGGTLNVANGGTGQTSFTAGQIHYGSFSTSSALTYNATSGMTVNGVTQGYNTTLYTVDGALSNYSASNAVYLNGNRAGWLGLQADGTQNTYIELYGSTNASPNAISFFTNTTQRFRIGSAGQWGIGGATYGTAGQVFTSGGASAAPTWTTPSAYAGPSATVVSATGSSTFTIPAGVTKIKVTVVGAGGGGAGTNSSASYSAGAGGGSGAAGISYLTGLTPGNTISVTVGTGGTAGGSTGFGGTGGSTSISSGTQTITTVTATGGAGGASGPQAQSDGSPPKGGNGGACSGATMNFGGNPGGNVPEVAGVNFASQSTSGAGGGSIFGGGGNPRNSNNGAGQAGQAFGAGGSGGSYQGTGFNGGAGASGVVLFEY